jgi:hypothetical protein
LPSFISFFACSYRKINISNIEELNKYSIKDLPSLVYIDNQKSVTQKYVGFIDETNKKNFLNRIRNDLSTK